MTEPPATEPIRILMADDEPVYLESTADLLRLKGFLVDTAQDAFQAAAFLRENTYDFLISDLVMPGNQDLDLLKVAAESCPDLNMIVITGYPSVATAREAIQLPVVAYLVKPVELDELLEHLHRGAAHVHMHRTLRQSKERMLGWVDEMAKMQDLLHHAPRALDQDMARTILGLALGNLSALLLDMKEIFEHSFGNGNATEFCAIQACPKLQTYQEAVQDAVAVLERTKTAFKSKDLAQLRERLENLNSGAQV